MRRLSIACGGIILLVCIGVLFFLFAPRGMRPFVSPLDQSPLVSLLPTPIPSPLVDAIFTEDHAWINNLPEDKKITLVATGDVIPARSVNYKTIQAKDFTWAWKNIAPLLSSGDITLVNLESPLIQGCKTTVEGMVFCGDPRHMEGLLLSGVDVVNLANNHAGNYGKEGIEETKQLLEDSGMLVVGLGETGMKKTKGVTFAFLGFDDIGPTVLPIARAEEKEMERQIRDARAKADIVVVSIHWGVEYTDKPSERQKELAHLAVDSGADLVIGNHPHWIQSLEFYNGKVIMYAHGNTIFDQMWSEETKFGVIGTYTFYDKQLVDIEFFPTYIKDYGQPMLVEGTEKEVILDHLQNISL